MECPRGASGGCTRFVMGYLGVEPKDSLLTRAGTCSHLTSTGLPDAATANVE